MEIKNENFNLVHAKRILDRLKDIEANPFKIRSSIEEPEFTPHVEPDPPRWLYWFVNQYTFIENEHLKSKVNILTDSEVTVLLKKYKTSEEMPIVVAYLPEVNQVLPEALKSRNDVKLITVADGPALSNLIYSITLVRIDSTKLFNAELLAFMKLPLVDKAKSFMNMVNQDKMKTETQDMILK